MERDGPAINSTVFMDRVGEVVFTVDHNSVSWKPVNADSSASSCLGLGLHLKTTNEIAFSDIYAIDLIGRGLIHSFVWDGGLLLGKSFEMNRFMVHSFCRNKSHRSPWVLSSYTFGHEDPQTCETWVERIHACISLETGRPKSLLVFVHPLCGKGNGQKIWESVAPMFARAKVKTRVIMTKKAGHALHLIKSSTNRELNSVDGIVAVGGDGLFNEILNGLVSTRLKNRHLPVPPNVNVTGINEQYHQQHSNDSANNDTRESTDDQNGTESLSKSDDREPLLSTTTESVSFNTDEDIEFSFPNDRFRLGIIPAGSTDAIVISTTGIRDPVTSALQIILGKKISLDVAQVVGWKTTPSSLDSPTVRYAASFAGYGFYGDVIKDSEKYRWMGPKRYDYAGTKVFLEHRSYEAEVSFLEDKSFDSVSVTKNSGSGQSSPTSKKNHGKVICRMNCTICNEASSVSMHSDRGIVNPNMNSKDTRWSQSKGRFLSVGAAVISCRNEKAPDGLVADAHLADGFLHLILVKECPRPFYLWHLTQLTRRGGNPLNFKFVEHHKTPVFTFVANHDQSAWNLDGELLQACEVTVRACRGLVNLFASGPEV